MHGLDPFFTASLGMSATVRKQDIFSEMYLYSDSAGYFHTIIGGWGGNKEGKVFGPGAHTYSSKFFALVT